MKSSKPVVENKETPKGKTVAQIEKEIADVQTQIEKDCKSLKNTIETANASDSEFPFYTNKITTPEGWSTGIVTWTATREPGPTPQVADPTVSEVSVDARQIARVLARPSIVIFVSDTPTIRVTMSGRVFPKLEWSLDLRDDSYVTDFVAAFKDLMRSLKEKDRLEKEKAKLSPPA